MPPQDEAIQALRNASNGQGIDPIVPPPQSPADVYAGAAPFAQALGLPDALKALKGQMTPEEGQNFFMQQAQNLLPEAKGAGMGLAALHLMPRALLPKVESGLSAGIRDTGAMPGQLADSLFGHGEPNAKSFDIANDEGNKVARMWTSQNDPKQLYVNYIAALDPATGEAVGAGQQANALGTKEMMSLLPELKKQFPGVEKIGGYRVSGARAASPGGPGPTVMALKGGL